MRNDLLRSERARRGWSQRQLADFALISLSTVERAERGESIRVDCIQRLCECFSKTPEELGLLKIDEKPAKNDSSLKGQPASPKPERLGLNRSMADNKKPLPILESNGYFSFGKMETALVVIDGNGIEAYLPQNIRTSYDFRPTEFLEEVVQMRSVIADEQAENENKGKPFLWNGDIYHLANHVVSRDPMHEQMKLSLWFRPTDYYTVLAKNKCLKQNLFRDKHLSDDWEVSMRFLPIPFGIGLSLITVDGYILFAQRKGDLGVHPGHFMTSVEEGLSRPLDRSSSGDAPDVYRCACRGLSEELGLIENSDFSVSDILFLALGLDTEYFMCGLRGLIKSPKTASEIIKNWQTGAKDKIENKKLFAIPFTPEDVCEFVFSHEPWGGGALMGIYHTLIHEFGKERVQAALSSC